MIDVVVIWLLVSIVFAGWLVFSSWLRARRHRRGAPVVLFDSAGGDDHGLN